MTGREIETALGRYEDGQPEAQDYDPGYCLVGFQDGFAVVKNARSGAVFVEPRLSEAAVRAGLWNFPSMDMAGAAESDRSPRNHRGAKLAAVALALAGAVTAGGYIGYDKVPLHHVDEEVTFFDPSALPDIGAVYEDPLENVQWLIDKINVFN